MSETRSTLLKSFAQTPLAYDDALGRLLPATVAQPLAKSEICTVEDLYECAAAAGAGWFKQIPGITAEIAQALMLWLWEYGADVGEVTARFFLPGQAPEALTKDSDEVVAVDSRIVPLEVLSVPASLSGEHGSNRAPSQYCSLVADNDLAAIHAWLNARAANENTRGNYRKEAERFLLWCLVERRTALSSIKADDASLYLRWLENLGRLDETAWSQRWREPQSLWIGPKNVPRLSPTWRPFNGPLQSASRRNAIVVVRQLFNFLKKTGYLNFNPFDQVSPKVPLLKGEGVPQAFADRSLTPEQWSEITAHLNLLPDGWPRERMKLILMLGKSLGMRASEMLDARTSWIVQRRLGFKVRTSIEIVGKGAKVRRLPLNDAQLTILNDALAARGLPRATQCEPETPLLINLGRGRHPHGTMTRSGLYRVLESFFDAVARDVESTSPMDAAKLRASSMHWLRHTFAVNALETMSVNVVQHAMGHASVATTGRYLSPEEETMSEAMEKMKPL